MLCSKCEVDSSSILAEIHQQLALPCGRFFSPNYSYLIPSLELDSQYLHTGLDAIESISQNTG